MSKDTKTGVVTETTLSTRHDVETLSPQEEQALRMLHGRSLDADAVLARKAPEGSAAAEALLRLETELLRQAVVRDGLLEEDAQLEDAPATDERMKQKIIRALRRK